MELSEVRDRDGLTILEARILRVLHVHGSLPLRGLHKYLDSHTSAAKLREALVSLRDAGHLSVRHGLPGARGGRPSQIWSLMELGGVFSQA
jgi:hypothetical protein